MLHRGPQRNYEAYTIYTQWERLSIDLQKIDLQKVRAVQVFAPACFVVAASLSWPPGICREA
jgi:hypothetical protein